MHYQNFYRGNFPKYIKGQPNWSRIMELRLDDEETLRPPRNSEMKARKLETKWKGSPPEFRYLRWLIEKPDL